MQYYAFPFIFRPEIFTLNGCETSPFYTIPQIFYAKSYTIPQVLTAKIRADTQYNLDVVSFINHMLMLQLAQRRCHN